MNSAAAKPHGNTRYPELQSKESLEALTKQFGTPSRIAKHLGCRASTVCSAMRRSGVKPRYFVADERVLARLGGK